MRNKLISIILAIAMCLPVVSFAATDNGVQNSDYSEDIAFVNTFMEGAISPDMADNTITRRDAVLLALRLHMKEFIVFEYHNEFADIPSDDPDAGKLALAVKLGIIPSLTTNKFNPDTKVAYIDALKMIFNSLGYGQLIRISGKGDSSYYRLASEYKCDLKAKKDFALTYGEMAHLIACALDTPILEENGVDKYNEVIYSKSDAVTPLSKYYGILKTEGTVVRNGLTSLYEKDGLNHDAIEINGTVLKCDIYTDSSFLLARSITAYYHKDTMVLKHYILNSDIATVTMECEDIDDFKNNVYYHYENGKTKKYTVTDTPAIIYNGVALNSDDAAYIEAGDIFIPSNGSVELVRSNSPAYNCIKITNYETYVVQGVDIDGRRIVDKYGKSVLDLDDAESLMIKNTLGETVDFEYIGYMNILSVAQSLDGRAARVIVCNDAVQGVLTTYNDNEIQLEVEVFAMSDRFKEITPLSAMPAINEEVILYLDARGKAAVCEVSPNNGWSYGYIIDKGVTAGLEKDYVIKMLTADNKIDEYVLNKNLKIDAETFTGGPATAYGMVPTESPVKYRLNVHNEIRELDTPAQGSKEKVTSLKPSYSSTTARWVDYISSFLGATFVKSGSVTFTVPVTPTGNEKDYVAGKVESSFVKEVDYNVATYMEDPGELVDTLVVKKAAVSAGVGGSDIITVVDRVVYGLDDDGNAVAKIYGMNQGIMRDYLVVDESKYSHENDPDPLERGDLIRISANSRREVLALERCFDNYDRLVESDLGSTNPSPSDLDVIFRLSYGKVLNMKNNILQVALENGITPAPQEKYYINGTVVVVDRNEVRAGSLSDIVSDTTGYASSKVAVEMRYMRIRTIIIYKDI